MFRISGETGEGAVFGLVRSDVHSIWNDAAQRQEGVPALLTVKQAAAIAQCHEETIRRAYWANRLKVQPFGKRGKRIHPYDLRDWMAEGMPTSMD